MSLNRGCLLADVGHVRGKITLPQKVLVSRALKSEVGKYSYWTDTRVQNHAWPQSSFSSQSSVQPYHTLPTSHGAVLIP